MTLFEETDTSDFTEILTKTLGITEDEVNELIEKLDVDQLTDLVDACIKGDTAAIKAAVGATMDNEAEDKGEAEKSDEPEIGDLLAPKDKLRAQKNQKKARILQKSEDKELGEEQQSITFGFGNTVAVDGQEATVKIPSAAGDTVGVLINGELKMVDRNKVHPLEEGVLGMSSLPGLKPTGDLQRIRELAGLPAEDFNEPEPAEFPAEQLPTEGEPVVGELPADVPMDGGMDAAPMDAMGMDAAPEAPVPDMGAPDMGGMPADMEAPTPAAPAAGPMDLGSGLEDAAALDQAISDIEGLIPNISISEYKTLVARLEALVAMAKSAGKAALTEGKKAPFVKPAAKKVAEASVGEDKISPKNKPEAAPKVVDAKPTKKDEEITGRKTLMDYVTEAAGDGHETIGLNRNDAIKSIQTRMGPGTTPQAATQAMDAMMKDGGIKQMGASFTMAPMDDNAFKTNIAATKKPTASPTQKPAAQNTGANTTNPGANVQGASNSAYQGG